jgi:hypothetical protein
MHQTIEEAEAAVEDYSIVCCKKPSKEHVPVDEEENKHSLLEE